MICILPSTRISRNQLIQCYRNAAALSRDPHLPYTIGSSVHLSAYGMYGYAMLCSTDFRRTMEFAVRYHQLATPLATIAFHERDRMGVWTIEPLLHPRIELATLSFRDGIADRDAHLSPSRHHGRIFQASRDLSALWRLQGFSDHAGSGRVSRKV